MHLDNSNSFAGHLNLDLSQHDEFRGSCQHNGLKVNCASLGTVNQHLRTSVQSGRAQKKSIFPTG